MLHHMLRGLFRHSTGGPASDPFFSSVTLLLNFNGTNGSTNIVDESQYGVDISVFGNAQLSTEQAKFGDTSLKLNGTGDYLTTPFISSRYDWDEEDSTIECFVFKPVGSAHWGGGSFGYPSLIGNSDPLGNYNYWTWGLFSNDEYGIYTFTTYGSLSTGVGITEGEWVHLAMVNDSGTLKFFVDGVLVHSVSAVNITTSAIVPLTIGQAYNRGIVGYLDSLRITRGVARYTDTFTPPTEGFPTS